MTKLRVLSLAGGLVVAAVVVTVLTYGGHRSHDVAAETRTTPAPSLTLALSATPTPSPTPRRHHTTTKKSAASSRRRTSGSSGGHSGVLPADPCAHNHHCSVPPLPPLKPHVPHPPAGSPSITITGAPATGVHNSAR